MNSSHFVDTRMIDYPQAHPLLAKLLDRYSLKLDDKDSAQSALVSLRVALPQGSALLWDRATSLPRQQLRRDLLRAVSLTLQDTIRCWLPYLWLSHPPHWDDRDMLWPMLIYASSRTFKPISRQTYAFDLLSENTLPSILRSSQPVLRQWLPTLQAIHHTRRSARRELRVERLFSVIEHTDFDPHPLKRLLAHEQKLIAAFMDLADSHAECSLERFGRLLHRHLTRIYINCDLSFLAPLLYLETENTLAHHLLGQGVLEATVNLDPPVPGLHTLPVSNRSPFLRQKRSAPAA